MKYKLGRSFEVAQCLHAGTKLGTEANTAKHLQICVLMQLLCPPYTVSKSGLSTVTKDLSLQAVHLNWYRVLTT